MILNMWISGVTTMLLFVINLLPNADSAVTAQINSTAVTFISYLEKANYVFPMDTLAIVIGIMITIEIVVLNWQIIKKVAHVISGGWIKL